VAERVPNRTRLGLARASLIQGFRAGYPWHGAVGRRFAQVGNAVCPPVARAVVAEAMCPSLVARASA